MRRLLLVSTGLAALASAAIAETVIADKRITTVRTSTIKQGTADDIRIAASGSVEVVGATPTVLIDSANKVINDGTIRATNTDHGFGILAIPGMSGGIVNNGKIIVDEVNIATDSDNDGDPDGPYATGIGRAAIVTLGAFSGDIVHTGGIDVLGNESIGIRLDGPLTGNLRHDGKTSITGDHAIGVAAGDVTGDVRLAGTISAKGNHAVGAILGGHVTGTLTVQGTLTATGYRTVVAPADPSRLDDDDLLPGGPALVIASDADKGIRLAVAPADTNPTDPDEDKDGIEDAKEGSAVIRSYGSAPAMLIGSAGHDIHIGAVPGDGHGLVIDGLVQGSGVYAGMASQGLRIDGLGNSVAIQGGILINGTVGADSLGGSAVALRLHSGAATSEIKVTGKVEATGSNTMSSLAAGIIVDEGGSVPVIRNSGTIKATATGEAGTAVGIWDFSGTVREIENSGAISATGAKANAGRNVAIDVSEQAADVTIRQVAATAGKPAPSIVGDIHFGGGNDRLEVSAGTVKGTTIFGPGTSALTLSGNAVYDGRVIFGDNGTTMALAGNSRFTGIANFAELTGMLDVGAGAVFQGTISHGHALAASVSGGTLDLVAPANLASLNVNNGGTIVVTLGQAGGTTPLIAVSGTASFAPQSKLALRITDIQQALGSHLVLTADNVVGGANLTANAIELPFLYHAALEGTNASLSVKLSPRTGNDLGLNRSEGEAFSAVYAALARDAHVAGAFLGLSDEGSFRATLRQMLPDQADGTFAAVTQGSRAFERMLQEGNGPFKDEGRWGYWISQTVWNQTKAIDETSGFDVSGWGIGTGAEVKTDAGNFGASFAYLWSRNRDAGTANQIRAEHYELAAYWRYATGGLRAGARGAVAFIDLSSTRSFEGEDGDEPVSLTAHGKRGTRLYAASTSASYEMGKGRIWFRPVLEIDYHHLDENGYAETGGGEAFDLIVNPRSSDELALTVSAATAARLGEYSQIEVEGGRREIVAGQLGKTVARFAGGSAFTLNPAERSSGWVGRLRAVAGSPRLRVDGAFNAEEQQGDIALALRASIRVGL